MHQHNLFIKVVKHFFVDTNILIYSVYEVPLQVELLVPILQGVDKSPFISTQVLKEFTNVSLRKKLHKTKNDLRQNLLKAKQYFNVSEISIDTIFEAIDLRVFG